MAAFHRGVAAVRDPEIGSSQAIAEIAAANLDEAERFRGRTVSGRRFEALRAYGREFVATRADTLDARFREGRIRDGHGDLRAEHVCIEESGEISIFDCVEFSARLRGSDVASEMAFLAMELDFLDAPELSETLLATYAAIANDPGTVAVERYHRWYRACVRGKVESYKSDRAEVPLLERRIAEERARRFFALASRYAEPPIPPTLVLVAGQIASGKSTLARLLADRTGFAICSSDRTRKALAGLAPTDRASGAERARLYSAELTERTYAALLDAAERELATGRGMILDATFAERRWRERAHAVAARLRRPFRYVECRADEATTLARLAERSQRADEASDATAEIYRERRDSFEASSEMPAESTLRLDTSAGPLGPLDEVEERLLGDHP
jgi:predicted kinase